MLFVIMFSQTDFVPFFCIFTFQRPSVCLYILFSQPMSVIHTARPIIALVFIIRFFLFLSSFTLRSSFLLENNLLLSISSFNFHVAFAMTSVVISCNHSRPNSQDSQIPVPVLFFSQCVF